MIYQIDMNVIKHNLIFFITSTGGMSCTPKDEFKEYWYYCYEIIIPFGIAIPSSNLEKYKYAGQSVIENPNIDSFICNFEFPDEETATYFILKYDM